MTDRRDHILRIIEERPGIRFREIMRISGMKNGVLSHHLRHMEDMGRLRVVRGPRQTSYSSLTITENQFRVARALQRPTIRAILLALAADDGLRFTEIVERCKKAPSTVSLYLASTIKDDLVTARTVDAEKRYYTNCRSDVSFLVDMYRPPRTEVAVSGFEDIINSL